MTSQLNFCCIELVQHGKLVGIRGVRIHAWLKASDAWIGFLCFCSYWCDVTEVFLSTTFLCSWNYVRSKACSWGWCSWNPQQVESNVEEEDDDDDDDDSSVMDMPWSYWRETWTFILPLDVKIWASWYRQCPAPTSPWIECLASEETRLIFSSDPGNDEWCNPAFQFPGAPMPTGTLSYFRLILLNTVQDPIGGSGEETCTYVRDESVDTGETLEEALNF